MAKNKTISVIWFTFKNDEKLVVESIKSVLTNIPNAKLHIIDDGFAAVSKETRNWIIQQKNTKYYKSFYPRSGHLLGQDNLKNQVKYMLDVTKTDKSDVLVKIDSDTMILNADWIVDFLEDDVTLITGSYKLSCDYPMGNCYAVKSSVLQPLYDDVIAYPGWGQCYEDYEVGQRIHRYADIHGITDWIHCWRSGVEDGFWLCDPLQVTEAARSARVISCGFSMGSIEAAKVAEYKQQQLNVMKYFNAPPPPPPQQAEQTQENTTDTNKK